MVVGEPQILGQMKEFYARAAGAGTAGAVLHRCFHKAFTVAKRVRTETGVASRAVSVSSAAVELASQDLRPSGGQDGDADRGGQDGRAGGPPSAGARRRRADRHQPHLRSRRGAGARVSPARRFPSSTSRGTCRWRTSSSAPRRPTGYVLTEPLIQEALRQRKGSPDVLHRHERAAQLRSPHQRDRQRLPLRHRRSRRASPRPTSTSARARRKRPRRSSARRSRRSGAGWPPRGRADHRRAARQGGGDPPQRAAEDAGRVEGPVAARASRRWRR